MAFYLMCGNLIADQSIFLDVNSNLGETADVWELALHLNCEM